MYFEVFNCANIKFEGFRLNMLLGSVHLKYFISNLDAKWNFSKTPECFQNTFKFRWISNNPPEMCSLKYSYALNFFPRKKLSYIMGIECWTWKISKCCINVYLQMEILSVNYLNMILCSQLTYRCLNYTITNFYS